MIGSEIHQLGELSEEACWLLLQRTALSGKDGDEWNTFERVGMKIANKCKGLPLAAKALGSLLYFMNSLDEWVNVLNSEIWELEEADDEVFRHLRLSYNELFPPALKRCFSYCGIFPKDTEIDVEELIQQWMALGYLGSDDASDMELKGREYFNKLAMRCLFQEFEKDGDLNGKIVSCKMHDIVHDFALLLRKNKDEEAGGIKETSKCKVCGPAALISRAKEYRSFGNCEEPYRSLCDCVANIRVVNLWEFNNQRIERFIHLRWLNLSSNKLAAKDMKTIYRLYNLQTLLLVRCDLKEISGEIGNLIHLRHLDLSENNSLKELPREIGNLIHLRHLDLHENKSSLNELRETISDLYKQRLNIHKYGGEFLKLQRGTLTEFRGRSNKLGWFKNLNRLSGSLRLVVELYGLENIVEDAKEGELKKKDGIQELEIKFEGWLHRDEEWVNLLDALQPHPNLVKLQIQSYRGSQLPSWMVFPVLNQLKFIRLDGFSELSSLPPLGKLPCLEEIVIRGIKKMQVVGPEFLGTTSQGSNSIVFPKLKRLTFEDCYNWREWEDITTTNQEEVAAAAAADSWVMPCLTELNIIDCRSLTALPHRLLASLEKLDISGSIHLEISYGIGSDSSKLALVFKSYYKDMHGLAHL